MNDVIADRLRQMCKAAKVLRKAVPSAELLERLVAEIVADGMKCPTCRRVMNWKLAECAATVVTLQHDRSGTIRLLCKGCNSRHAHHPGDTFYDLPAGHKRCPACETVKPAEDFGPNRSPCKACERARALAYYRANRDQCKARHRAYMKATPDQQRDSRKGRRKKAGA